MHKTDHLKRMYKHGLELIEDSEFLANSGRISDLSFFGKVLGFEILLKCILYEINSKKYFSHCYKKLWGKLPDAIQSEILSSASGRIGDLADFSDINNILNNFEKAFNKGRYFYEIYENKTRKEEKNIGDNWIKNGAFEDEADIVYHPNELTGLIYGLKCLINKKLNHEQKTIKKLKQNKENEKVIDQCQIEFKIERASYSIVLAKDKAFSEERINIELKTLDKNIIEKFPVAYLAIIKNHQTYEKIGIIQSYSWEEKYKLRISIFMNSEIFSEIISSGICISTNKQGVTINTSNEILKWNEQNELEINQFALYGIKN